MSQKKFEINQTVLSDAKAMNERARLEEIFKIAEDTISDGGFISIVQEYENAPTEPVKKITKKSDLDELKKYYLS